MGPFANDLCGQNMPNPSCVQQTDGGKINSRQLKLMECLLYNTGATYCNNNNISVEKSVHKSMPVSLCVSVFVSVSLSLPEKNWGTNALIFYCLCHTNKLIHHISICMPIMLLLLFSLK